MIVATDVSAGNAADAAAAAAAGLLAQGLPAEAAEAAEAAETMIADEPLTVYGDSAYGTGALRDTFEQDGVIARCKTQPPRAPAGRFPKSEFGIDLDAGTVRYPAKHTVALRPIKNGQIARFGKLCAGCPLAERCTASRSGRTIISVSTSVSSPRLAPINPTRPGGLTTCRPAPPWSARSLT